MKTPSCCRIPQRTCQDLGDPGKLSSQDIATGIQQHGIHTHMQTQNLWDKKLVEKREPNFCTSFTEELLLKYENLDLEMTVGFHVGRGSPKLYIQSIQPGYDLHAASQQPRVSYAYVQS